MNDELDLTERRLCPDGTCIGVVGDDGRCRVCGRRDDGAPQAAGAALGLAEELAGGAPEPGDGADPDDPHGPDGLGDDDDDDDRQLCPNESCIGLIGGDGRCKVCGTPARS
jgi:hypothetical protein